MGPTIRACYLTWPPALEPTACAQDFEALTPNLLARTIETVEGGGIIVLLLSTLESLTQLYSLTMDVHARFRTQSHQEVAGEPTPLLDGGAWVMPPSNAAL